MQFEVYIQLNYSALFHAINWSNPRHLSVELIFIWSFTYYRVVISILSVEMKMDRAIRSVTEYDVE